MSFFGIALLFIPTICVVLLLKFIVRYLFLRNEINKFVGPPDLPFIGNVHQLERDPVELRRQLQGWSVDYSNQGYGTCRFWVGTQPYIVIIKGRDAEVVLHSSKHLDKSDVYNYMHEWLGRGLLTSTGAKWKSRRRLLTPSFHFNILNDFMDIFNQQSRVLVEKLTETVPCAEDVFTLVTRCTLDIICETAMGIKMETQSQKNVEYIYAVHEVSAIIQRRQKYLWLFSDLLFPLLPDSRRQRKSLQLLKQFTRKVIETRRAEIEGQLGDGDYDKPKRVAFLTTLLRTLTDQVPLSDDDVQEEVDTFMFEGHDTTSSGITWAIHMIGAHPDVRDKLHREVDEVFGDSDRDATDEDLKKLTYLSCVMKEVMRLCPPVPFIGRELTEDQNLGGVDLKKGTNVVIMVYTVHRDADEFPDPEKFDPDRFLPENNVGHHPYAYIPFSAGPRNCIGQRFAQMEQKVVISWLLRRFWWKTVQTYEELRATVELILRPTVASRVEIRPRR